MTFKQNCRATLLFKAIQYNNHIFQSVKPALQNHLAKPINLELNLSLISNKAPNLYSIMCSEMNTVSITNYATVKRKW